MILQATKPKPQPMGTFFGIHEAAELCIAAWGIDARCWNRAAFQKYERGHECEVGTGGAGRDHIIRGFGSNWLDAVTMAGLLTSK